jgi:hypothetical protein
LVLAVWDSADAAGGGDELYDVALQTLLGSVIVTNTKVLVQIDNTAPTAELEKTGGTCVQLTSGDMPYTVSARIQDAHFYTYVLSIAGGGYGPHDYAPVAYYEDASDGVIDVGTTNWDTFVDLHAVDVGDVGPDPVGCGYSVELRARERTLLCDFLYASNIAVRCVDCREASDTWTFSYQPVLIDASVPPPVE